MTRTFAPTALMATAMGFSLIAVPAYAAPFTVTVKIENLAPAMGNLLTPVWMGFHNGTFDLYNMGQAVSPQLERLAEDGNTAPLSGLFAASAGAITDGTSAGPIAPGGSVTTSFVLDNNALTYFSYASMVIPSNDAFIANGNPLAFQLFNGTGGVNNLAFTVLGSMVLDAGSEVNDELPMNTAAFGQTEANTGVSQNGVVALHPGFMMAGSGGILDNAMFQNADFRAPGYQVARITVTASPVPEPLSLSLLAFGLGVIGVRARRRR